MCVCLCLCACRVLACVAFSWLVCAYLSWQVQVWTLLHNCEDLMLMHGTLDEIAAEKKLVEQTYTAMCDHAIKT